jgi:signal transduction histidine kinase
VLNALAAVPRPGGRVTLACGGDRATIFYRVRDNGPGIPREIRPRLFEPRVTLRPGGTGLGLAVARQIVVAHHGTIEFETSTDGTCFTVILPREAVVGKET